MSYRRVILYSLGIFTAYYCMSIWGMGINNPVKHYLYIPVLLFSFLLVAEIHRIMIYKGGPRVNGFFLLVAALILAGLTAVLFSEYELSVFRSGMARELKRYPGLLPGSS